MHRGRWWERRTSTDTIKTDIGGTDTTVIDSRMADIKRKRSQINWIKPLIG